ncbi:MAG TPA: phosphoribosyltransferase family protein [Bellilinea sp.]|nr:phosphoribosyltransferase family protein [Bellilinea sp.]
MKKRESYPIVLAGVERELPLFQVEPGLKIALLNILGDVELVRASTKALIKMLKDVEYDVIITAESKSIPLAYEMARQTKKPYVVLRKSYKFYMGDAIKAETVSITTLSTQQLFLDEKDHNLIKGKKVLIVDDVISTGSTLGAMRDIVTKAGAEIVGEAAICTEGEEAHWKGIYALAHLPLFKG